jgi:quinol monooxygenase YgiN
MIIVAGEVCFADGEIARLKGAMERNIAATRGEPGCARYIYAVDVSDPNRLIVSEEWSDADAVDAHMASAHMAEFMAEFAKAKIESAAIHAYEGHYLRTLVGAGPEAGD